eukprot:1183487-Ditylum_brightwellii.AAC.1
MNSVSKKDMRHKTYNQMKFFHELVDVAIQQYDTWNDDDDDDEGERKKQRRSLVDLGSGCGRLALYAALTRGGGG